MSPRVSVLLPVYNVAPYIEEAITSILQQTFTDFELLVLDDCSTDDTADKVRAIQDPRVRFMQNPRNLGRAGTDNAALPYVRGEFIAKMDGDDICPPERLALQVAFLDGHPDVNTVGTWIQNFGASTYLNRYRLVPAETRVRTLFTTPTGNATVLMRASLFKEQGLTYDGSLRQTEDYDFFARYVRELHVATIPVVLYLYRIFPTTARGNILSERATVTDQVQARLLTSWGLAYTPRELRIHNTITILERPLADIRLAEVEAWLQRLIQFNEEQPLFDPQALRQGLAERWFEVCYTHVQPKLGNVRQFMKSPLAAYHTPPAQLQLKMWLKAARHFFG